MLHRQPTTNVSRDLLRNLFCHISSSETDILDINFVGIKTPALVNYLTLVIYLHGFRIFFSQYNTHSELTVPTKRREYCIPHKNKTLNAINRGISAIKK